MVTQIKIVAFNNPAPGKHTHMFMCPGCGYAHCFSESKHMYNGNPHKPTIGRRIEIAGHLALFKCVSSIANGRITFYDDCTHSLRGMEMELPDVKTS